MSHQLEVLVGEWTRGTIVGGFCLDSGYYAGRPPTTSDLDSKVLEAIYQGLMRTIGQAAATNFVRFVNSLDDLAASSFIVAFRRFYSSGCEQPNILQQTSDRIEITSSGDTAISQSFGAIAETFGNRSLSEARREEISLSIKGDFIRRHLKEIPENERRELPPPARCRLFWR